MKKGLFAFVFIALLLANSVSAYYFPSFRATSQDLVYTITDLMEPVLMALFGPWSSAYLFETLLIFLIVLSIVYLALGKIDLIKDQKAVRNTLTVVIPLLSVRFFDYEWLVTIFNSYKLLGIVFSSILPFILYFFFLHNAAKDHGIIRKLGWGLWIAVYAGLWTSEYTNEYTSLVYFWTFIVGLVCLVGDNFIQRRFRALERMRGDEYFKQRELGRIRTEIQELERQIASRALDPKVGRDMIKDLHNHIKWLNKQ